MYIFGFFSELSNLRTNPEFCTDGFNELLSVCCIQGKYPQHLLDLWNLYDEDGGSENDSPEIFTDDQLYIVLDLANGGQDLEAYRFNNAEQAYSLFVQVRNYAVFFFFFSKSIKVMRPRVYS